jgi:beta-galactosidase
VIAYTNCDSVELFVNGKSWGSKTLEFPRQGNAGAWNRYARPYTPGSTLDLHLSWDVPYAPGSIRAVGKRNGQVVAETEIKTAGNPAAIKLSVDRNRLAADARDVAHFTVQVVDANGVAVPNANPTITFDLKGPAKLIATDNGDLSDVLTPNNSKTRHAFNGMALAIIQSTRDAGKISLTASMEGAAPVTVDVESISAQP